MDEVGLQVREGLVQQRQQSRPVQAAGLPLPLAARETPDLDAVEVLDLDVDAGMEPLSRREHGHRVTKLHEFPCEGRRHEFGAATHLRREVGGEEAKPHGAHNSRCASCRNLRSARRAAGSRCRNPMRTHSSQTRSRMTSRSHATPSRPWCLR